MNGPIRTAGLKAASLVASGPAALAAAVGNWIADHQGAERIMDIQYLYAPGDGVTEPFVAMILYTTQ